MKFKWSRKSWSGALRPLRLYLFIFQTRIAMLTCMIYGRVLVFRRLVCIAILSVKFHGSSFAPFPPSLPMNNASWPLFYFVFLVTMAGFSWLTFPVLITDSELIFVGLHWGSPMNHARVAHEGLRCVMA